MLSLFQFLYDAVVGLLIELVEAEAYGSENPKCSRYGGESMVHDAQYLLILSHIAHISCASEGDGEERCSYCHADFIAQ